MSKEKKLKKETVETKAEKPKTLSKFKAWDVKLWFDLEKVQEGKFVVVKVEILWEDVFTPETAEWEGESLPIPIYRVKIKWEETRLEKDFAEKKLKDTRKELLEDSLKHCTDFITRSNEIIEDFERRIAATKRWKNVAEWHRKKLERMMK